MNGKNNLSIKEWAPEDRPRERMLTKGKKELTNAELLAILVRTGTSEMSAVELSKKILNDADNSLIDLSKMEIGTFVNRYKGMGETKAITVLAALELGIRMLHEKDGRQNVYINNADDLFRHISPEIINLNHEEFWTIYLNAKRRCIFKQRISSGGISDAPVDIRIIFRTAVEKNAVSIMLAHNHPTGNLTPSREDRMLTNKIIQAGKTLNIAVDDHLIVGIDDAGHANYYSFYEHNDML
ncbi:MAG: DNA repair protein RadC [Bacteroidales bacterium]|nr:DNA repair protein RadC [Bacteroidales bacterium]